MFEKIGPSGLYVIAQAEREAPPAETHAATGAHGGAEHKGVFPPFDSATFPSQLFWLAIFFGLLLWLMAKVALPRVGAILEGRADRIASDLAEANRLKEETDAAIEAYEKTLTQARAEGQRIAAEMHEKVSKEAEENRRRLEDELNGKLAAAERQIADTKASALSNVRGIAVEAGSAIVERLTGKAPESAEIEQAVDASLAA